MSDTPRSSTPWESDPDFTYQSEPGSRPPAFGAGGYPHQRGPATSSEQSMAMLAHLSTIVAFVLSVGWLSFLGPLIVWFVYKDRSPYVRQAAAGAFNFNITMWLVTIAGWIAILTLIGAIIGIPVIIVAFLLQLVYHILGAVRANRGEAFSYPFQLRLLS